MTKASEKYEVMYIVNLNFTEQETAAGGIAFVGVASGLSLLLNSVTDE